MTIGERIKNLREHKGSTQEELANVIGSTKQTIYKYENNIIINIPSDKIESIAKALGTTPAYLMGWEPSPNEKYYYNPKTGEKIIDLAQKNPVDRSEQEQVKRFNAFYDCANTELGLDGAQIMELMPSSLDFIKIYAQHIKNVRNGLEDKVKFGKIVENIRQYMTLDFRGKALVDSVIQKEYEYCVPSEGNEPLNMIPFRISDQPASAGRGTYLGPESFTTIMVEKNDLTKCALFGVPILGDSMEPRYRDKDILIVERADELELGEIGVFTLDGEGYVKQYGDGQLISLNPDYKPIPMNDSIVLNGKVIGVLERDWIVE